MIAARVAAGILGAGLVWLSLASAIRTLVMPRSAQDGLTRGLFVGLRSLYGLLLRWVHSYRLQDRLLATFAPVGVLMLLPTWLTGVLLGFAGLYFGAGIESAGRALVLSGSSLFTLGFERADGPLMMTLIFSEATIGLLLVALLIAYLPTMYNAFSRRERAVNLLTVRAGSPVSAVEMIERLHRVAGLENLQDTWLSWEAWFAEIEESHTSLTALVFFRSPQPDESWVTAAGTVMDAAALMQSVVDQPSGAPSALCIRAGYVALRRIADSFGLAHDSDPTWPECPISITRDEFDDACRRMEDAGVPLLEDREQAWEDFAGWRVNYDEALLSLALLVAAPYAPWTSDRSPAAWRLRGRAPRIRVRIDRDG